MTGIFWVTSAIALLLGYAIRIGPQAVQEGVLYCGFVLLFGALFGSLAHRWKDALFWSALATLLAYLAVAGGHLPNAAVGYGWGAVGAICGAAGGVRWPKNEWLGTIMSGLLAVLAMLASLIALRESITALVGFDVACAGAIGVIFRPFIRFLQWFETQSKQPRIVLASWLAVTILIGNFLVPIIGGVHR